MKAGLMLAIDEVGGSAISRGSFILINESIRS